MTIVQNAGQSRKIQVTLFGDANIHTGLDSSYHCAVTILLSSTKGFMSNYLLLQRVSYIPNCRQKWSTIV